MYLGVFVRVSFFKFRKHLDVFIMAILIVMDVIYAYFCYLEQFRAKLSGISWFFQNGKLFKVRNNLQRTFHEEFNYLPNEA